MTLPRDKMTLPRDKMTLPRDKMTLPRDKMTLPRDKKQKNFMAELNKAILNESFKNKKYDFYFSW